MKDIINRIRNNAKDDMTKEKIMEQRKKDSTSEEIS